MFNARSRIALLAIVSAVFSVGVAGASDSILKQRIQQRRAEYRLHRELGAGTVVSAIPGKAGLRGAVLQQKVAGRLRQRLSKKKEVPAIQTSTGSSPTSL